MEPLRWVSLPVTPRCVHGAAMDGNIQVCTLKTCGLLQVTCAPNKMVKKGCSLLKGHEAGAVEGVPDGSQEMRAVDLG